MAQYYATSGSNTSNTTVSYAASSGGGAPPWNNVPMMPQVVTITPAPGSIGGAATTWQGTMPMPAYPLPSSGQWNVPNPNMPNSTYTIPITPPADGSYATINGQLYRYVAASDEWQLVTDPSEVNLAEVPEIPIELDATAMLAALREYKRFLEELDGLTKKSGEVVSDTLFGLDEAIEALSKLE